MQTCYHFGAICRWATLAQIELHRTTETKNWVDAYIKRLVQSQTFGELLLTNFTVASEEIAEKNKKLIDM